MLKILTITLLAVT